MTIRAIFPQLRRWELPAVAACVIVGSCFPVFAADGKSTGPSEALFLVQIIILVVVGRLLGEAMVRIGQPSIMGQIIGGILLGPSVFGYLLPAAQSALFPALDTQKAMADAVADAGRAGARRDHRVDLRLAGSGRLAPRR